MNLRKQSQLLLFMILLTFGICQFACGGGDSNNGSQEETQKDNSAKSSEESSHSQESSENTGNTPDSIPLGTLCIKPDDVSEEVCATEITATRTVSDGNVSFEVIAPFPVEAWEYLEFAIQGSIPEGASLPRLANTFMVSAPIQGECVSYKEAPGCWKDIDPIPPDIYMCERNFDQENTYAEMKIISFTPDSVQITFKGYPNNLTWKGCCWSDIGCSEASFYPTYPNTLSGRLHVSF